MKFIKKNILYILSGIILLTLFGQLFYRSSFITDQFDSDFESHINFVDQDHIQGAYSLMHYLAIYIGKFIRLFISDLYTSNGIAVILINLIAIACTWWVTFKFLFTNNTNVSTLKTIIITFSTTVLSMLFFDINGQIYLGNGTINTWHNPTFIVVKPLSILVFIYSFKIFNSLFNKIKVSYSQYFLLSLFTTLCMATKPSFLLSFLPTISIIACGLFLTKKINFKEFFKIFITFLISLIPLAIIYKTSFNIQSKDTSVVFQTGELWNLWSDNILFSIFKANAFPIFVLIIFYKKINNLIKLALINFIISIFIVYFFKETGFREFHGNFFWTYLSGILFLFLTTIDLFFFKIKTKHPLVNGIGISLFALHTICGILYFYKQYTGGSYL